GARQGRGRSVRARPCRTALRAAAPGCADAAGDTAQPRVAGRAGGRGWWGADRLARGRSGEAGNARRDRAGPGQRDALRAAASVSGPCCSRSPWRLDPVHARVRVVVRRNGRPEPTVPSRPFTNFWRSNAVPIMRRGTRGNRTRFPELAPSGPRPTNHEAYDHRRVALTRIRS